MTATDMGAIATARADLVEAVGAAVPAGTKVYGAMPGRITPPCVVLAESSPLLEASEQATGAVTIHMEAVAFVAGGLKPAALAKLDALADTLTEGLWDYLPRVSYGTITIDDGNSYLIARLQLDTTYTIH